MRLNVLNDAILLNGAATLLGAICEHGVVRSEKSFKNYNLRARSRQRYRVSICVVETTFCSVHL